MDGLMAAVNRLRQCLQEGGLDQRICLPRIVVVGDQSSGKSSLLERLAQLPDGCQLLPKGEGMVTRSPICLQLVRDPQADPPWASLAASRHPELNEPRVRSQDVAGRLAELTRRITGSDQAVTDEEITVELHGAHLADLTVVDLPGLVAWTGVGSDAPDQIDRLVAAEIAKPHTLVLGVVSAADDAERARAFRHVHEAGKGAHTLFVVNKLDLATTAQQQQAVLRMLHGDLFPDSLGYFGTVCAAVPRHGASAAAGPRLVTGDEERARLAELAWLGGQGCRLGVDRLQDTLAVELQRHVRASAGGLIDHVARCRNEYAVELSRAPAVPEPSARLLRQALRRVAGRIRELVAGDAAAVAAADGLVGGARVYDEAVAQHGFRGDVARARGRLRDAARALPNDAICSAVRNADGAFPPGDTGHRPFKLLVARLLGAADLDALCERAVGGYARALLAHVVAPAAAAAPLSPGAAPHVDLRACFPNLWSAVERALRTLLEERAAAARRAVRTLVCMQRDYIDTDHPAWAGRVGWLPPLRPRPQRTLSAAEAALLDELLGPGCPAVLLLRRGHLRDRLADALRVAPGAEHDVALALAAARRLTAERLACPPPEGSAVHRAGPFRLWRQQRSYRISGGALALRAKDSDARPHKTVDLHGATARCEDLPDTYALHVDPADGDTLSLYFARRAERDDCREGVERAAHGGGGGVDDVSRDWTLVSAGERAAMADDADDGDADDDDDDDDGPVAALQAQVDELHARQLARAGPEATEDAYCRTMRGHLESYCDIVLDVLVHDVPKLLHHEVCAPLTDGDTVAEALDAAVGGVAEGSPEFHHLFDMAQAEAAALRRHQGLARKVACLDEALDLVRAL